MPEVVLRLSGVSKHFGGVQALADVSFELRSGEVHAIVGENGAGKSTLIKIVTGAHSPDEGRMEILGRHVAQNDPVTSRRLGIAAIYQQPALFPDLSVAENIAIGLEPGGPWHRIRWRERRRRAAELLNLVGARIDPEAEIRSLSMPEQQLVEIARALGADARIVIMDEPTASLGDQEVEHLYEVIHNLKQRDVGIVYISHRLDELPKVADRVTALRDGRIVGTKPMNEVDRAELVRMMVGREVNAVFPKLPTTIGEVVLEAKNLGTRQSHVHGVDLQIRSGEIVGLAGLVGSGRTELARILFGLTPADTGSIRLHGREVTIGSPGEAVALGIAYVPEDRRRHGVILPMSVSENTSLASLRAVARGGFLRESRELELAQRLTQTLGVKTRGLGAPVSELSGGNQQKVALGRWLATKPSVLILDEPTQGVDVGAKAEIHRLMSELAGQGLAILMISSELPEILGMSDRIAVMFGGSVVGVLDRAEANQETVLEMALGHTIEGEVAS